jgi:TRAP-type C4-dicarboxylate transport system permease small subunit
VGRLNAAYGRLLELLALLGAFLIFLMMILICVDVGMRALRAGSLSWVTEVSEYILYLSTFLSAPLLLRLGRHVRMDIVLRALPGRAGWALEWAADLLGLLACTVLTVVGVRAVLLSRANGSIIQKTIEMPEWVMLIPVPVAFFFLAVEFVFRVYRLSRGPRQVRDEATSTA